MTEAHGREAAQCFVEVARGLTEGMTGVQSVRGGELARKSVKKRAGPDERRQYLHEEELGP